VSRSIGNWIERPLVADQTTWKQQARTPETQERISGPAGRKSRVMSAEARTIWYDITVQIRQSVLDA